MTLTPRTLTYLDWFKDVEPALASKFPGKSLRDFAGVYEQSQADRYTNTKPYQDFWHVLIDVAFTDVNNDSYYYAVFAEAQECVDRDHPWASPIMKELLDILAPHLDEDLACYIFFSW